MTKTELFIGLNNILQAPSTTSVGAYDTVIKEAIRHIESEPEWIPVSEIMPEVDGDYLITWHINGSDDLVLLAGWGLNEWIDCYGCRFEDTSNITAWMPLPKPYKGEK